MNLKLAQLLRETCPHLYLNCPDFSCLDGWFPLLLDLSRALEAICVVQAGQGKPIMRAIEVKSKYASLSFYLDHGTDEAFRLVSLAEDKSEAICEACGGPGREVEIRNWLWCLCERHEREWLGKTGEFFGNDV